MEYDKDKVDDMVLVLQNTVGKLYSTSCRAQLGDARCHVNLSELTPEGAVSVVKNAHEFIAAGLSKPN